MKSRLLFVLLVIGWVAAFAQSDLNIELVDRCLVQIGDVKDFVTVGTNGWFTGGEAHLQIMDLSDLNSVQAVTAFSCDDIGIAGAALEVVAGYALIIHAQRRISVIAGGDTANPALCDTISFSGTYKDHRLRGTVLYLLTNTDLISIDVANPLAGQVLDAISIPGGHSNLEIKDDLALINTTPLTLVNISAPSDLQPAGSLSLGVFSMLGVNGNFLFGFTSGGDFVAWDISNPSNPVYCSSLGWGPCEVLGKTRVQGDYLILRIWGPDYNDGTFEEFCFLDISDPYAMSQTSFDVVDGHSTFEISGNILCEFYPQRYLRFAILDGTLPPVFTDPCVTGSVGVMAKDGDYAVALVGGYHYQRLELAPEPVLDQAWQIPVTNLIYTAVHNGLLCYSTCATDHDGNYTVPCLNIADAQTGEILYSHEYFEYGHNPISKIAGSGNQLFLCIRHAGILILDIQNPSNPVPLGSIQDDWNYRSLCLDGDLLWAAVSNWDQAAILCYDISNPAACQLTLTIPLNGQNVSSGQISKIGDYIYVDNANTAHPDLIINVSDPLNPSVHDSPVSFSGALDILPFADGMLVTRSGRVVVYNLQNPLNPQRVGEYNFGSTVKGLLAMGTTLYAGLGSCVAVLDASAAYIAAGLEDVPDTPIPGISVSNQPNPFKGDTEIILELPASGTPDVRIYNLRGQEVFGFASETRMAGPNSLIWSGRDSQGNALSSGIYLLRVNLGSRTAYCKLALLK